MIKEAIAVAGLVAVASQIDMSGLKIGETIQALSNPVSAITETVQGLVLPVSVEPVKQVRDVNSYSAGVPYSIEAKAVTEDNFCRNYLDYCKEFKKWGYAGIGQVSKVAVN